MMTVSTNEYVLYTLYKLTLINIYYFFPKELIVLWARHVYIFSENQAAATVELVIDSTFEVAQVSIQGIPRQIPDGNPNRIDSLVVPGPAGEVKLPLLCTFHRHLINLFVSDYTHLCRYAYFLLFKGLPLMPPLREYL